MRRIASATEPTFFAVCAATASLRDNTPAMPLTEAQIGGFYLFTPWQYAIHPSGSAEPGGAFISASPQKSQKRLFRFKSALSQVSAETGDKFIYTRLRAFAVFCAQKSISLFSRVNTSFSVRHNTPAMPLTEAHFGGSFFSGARQ